MFDCIEVVAWKPTRRHAKDRRPTRWVIGVTNYDKCSGVYWLITEVDKKYAGSELEARIEEAREEYGVEPAMIFETVKGYHFYWSFSHQSPWRIVALGFKLEKRGLADRHHLKLARERGRDLEGRLILRVSPKHGNDRLVPLLVKPASEWHSQVLLMIALANSGKLVVTKGAYTRVEMHP